MADDLSTDAGCEKSHIYIKQKKKTGNNATTTVVDNGVFKTRTEAETGMKAIKVCSN